MKPNLIFFEDIKKSLYLVKTKQRIIQQKILISSCSEELNTLQNQIFLGKSASKWCFYRILLRIKYSAIFPHFSGDPNYYELSIKIFIKFLVVLHLILIKINFSIENLNAEIQK